VGELGGRGGVEGERGCGGRKFGVEQPKTIDARKGIGAFHVNFHQEIQLKEEAQTLMSPKGEKETPSRMNGSILRSTRPSLKKSIRGRRR